jgi:hypothetical protein
MANALDFPLRIFSTWIYIKGILRCQPLSIFYLFKLFWKINLSLNAYFLCMYTWIQTFCCTQRTNSTTQLAKSRRRIFKDIYLNEYMTIACVRHLTLTIEQKYFVSYNYNAFSLWQLKISTTELTNKRNNNGQENMNICQWYLSEWIPDNRICVPTWC